MKKLWRPDGRFLFFILFLCLLCSCGKDNDVNTRSSQLSMETIDAARLAQAKHDDIPLPVGYDFVDFDSSCFDNTITDFFCYQGILSFEEVLVYYKTNMERLGWRIEDLSNKKEGLFFCDKRYKRCVISVRNICVDSPCNVIYMFVKNRLKKEAGTIKDINSKDISKFRG